MTTPKTTAQPHPQHHPSYGRLLEIRQMIERRTPREDAKDRVRVSAPLSRTCYWSLMRLDGAPDDVLDYAAYLLDADLHSPHPGRGPLQLEAVEHDAADELSLVLSRTLYDDSE